MSLKDLKVGDKVTIEGLNINKVGKLYFNKKRNKKRRTPMPVLTVISTSCEVKNEQ